MPDLLIMSTEFKLIKERAVNYSGQRMPFVVKTYEVKPYISPAQRKCIQELTDWLKSLRITCMDKSAGDSHLVDSVFLYSNLN